MKQILFAALAVTAGSVAFADVFDVKFTATTAVDAAKTYRGETVEYLKKGSVVVQGLYNSETEEYYFWEGKKKPYQPIQGVVFEGDAMALDTEINGKNATMDAQLLWGGVDGENNLTAAGMGTFLKSGEPTLSRISGNFAGRLAGLPAYGSWSIKKNSTATRDLDAYLKKQGLSKDMWNAEATAEAKKQYEDWRKEVADLNKIVADLDAALAEITGLNETVTNQNTTIASLNTTVAEQKTTIEGLNASVTEKNAQIAGLQETVSEQTTEIAALEQSIANTAAAIKALDDASSVIGTLSDYLNGEKAIQENIVATATAKIAAAQALDFSAAAEGLAEKEQAIANAQANVAVAQTAVDKAAKGVADQDAAIDALVKDYEFKRSVVDGSYYPAKETIIQGYQDANTELEAEIATQQAIIDEIRTNAGPAAVAVAYTVYTNATANLDEKRATLVEKQAALTEAQEALTEAQSYTAAEYTLEVYCKENGITKPTADDIQAYEAAKAAKIKAKVDGAHAAVTQAQAEVDVAVNAVGLAEEGANDAQARYEALRAAGGTAVQVAQIAEIEEVIAGKNATIATNTAAIAEVQAEIDATRALNLTQADVDVAKYKSEDPELTRVLNALRAKKTEADTALADEQNILTTKVNERDAYVAGDYATAARAYIDLVNVDPRTATAEEVADAVNDYIATYEETKEGAARNVASIDLLLAELAK